MKKGELNFYCSDCDMDFIRDTIAEKYPVSEIKIKQYGSAFFTAYGFFDLYA